MNRLVPIFLVLCAPLFTWAQYITSEWTQYQNTKTAGGYGPPYVYVDKEQNVIVCGETYHPGSVTGFIVTKYDPSGNLLWESRMDSPALDQPVSATLDSSGYPYVAGYMKAQFVSILEGLLLKYDRTTGDTLWSYRYTYPTPLNSSFSQVLITPAQEVWVLGAATDLNTNQYFTFLVILDTEGHETKRIELQNGVGDIIKPVPGGYVVWGAQGGAFTCWQLDTEGNEIDQYSTDFYSDPSGGEKHVDKNGNLYVGDRSGEHKVTKYDPQGNLVWAYAKPYVAHPSPFYVTARGEGLNTDNAGNVFFGGMYYNGTDRRHLFTCLDAQGELLWEHQVVFLDKYYASGVRESILVGDKNLSLGSYRIDSINNYNICFVAISESNGFISGWLCNLPGNNNWANSLHYTQNNIYITAGNSDDLSNETQLVSKYKADFLYSPTQEWTSAKIEKMHPNPAASSTILSLYNPKAEDRAILELMDIKGTVVRSRKVALVQGQQQVVLDELDGLPTGTYFVRIGTVGYIFTGKLVKSD
jgi:hypothetical protein